MGMSKQFARTCVELKDSKNQLSAYANSSSKVLGNDLDKYFQHDLELTAGKNGGNLGKELTLSMNEEGITLSTSDCNGEPKEGAEVSNATLDISIAVLEDLGAAYKTFMNDSKGAHQVTDTANALIEFLNEVDSSKEGIRLKGDGVEGLTQVLLLWRRYISEMEIVKEAEVEKA